MKAEGLNQLIAKSVIRVFSGKPYMEYHQGTILGKCTNAEVLTISSSAAGRSER